MPASSFKSVILNEADEVELQNLISKLEVWELLLAQEMNVRGAGRSSTAPETPATRSESVEGQRFY